MERFSGQAGEVGVFHGTPKEETIHWICSLGFDQRMNGTHGTKYGKGAYFATAASYSHQYTHPTGTAGLRSMFYARVLVGQKVEGKSEYRRPPPIDPHDPKRGLYDTCVDNVANPNIFVVFDNNQSYPDYLIEYRESVAAAGAKSKT